MRKRWLARLFLVLAILTLAPAVRSEEPEDTPWLTGRVVDPDGTPVASVGVIAKPESSNDVSLARMDREDGSFVFPKLPPGPVRLTIEADGYESLERQIEPGSADLPLVVVLPREDFKQCRTRTPEPEAAVPEPEPDGEPGTTVTGRVLGLTPWDVVQGVRVLLQGNPLIQGDRAFVHQVLGSSGMFRMEGIPPGVWMVIVDAGQRRAGARSVTLIPGQREAVVDLELPPAATTWPVRGSAELKVVDQGGRPIPGATVHISMTGIGGAFQQASTTADGTVRLGALPPYKTLWLLIERKGFVSAVRELSLRPGEARSVQATLLPGVRVEGRVVNESGWPVAGAEVALSGDLLGPGLPDDPSGLLDSRETLRVKTSRTGRFRFDDLPEGLLKGNIALLFRHPSYMPLRQVLPLDSGDLGKIVLRRGTVLAGRVVDRDGRPVAGLPVRAFLPGMDDDEPPALSALTGPDGAFVLPHVPAAEVRLTVCREDVRELTEWVEPAGQRVELTVLPGATLRGRVLDPYGRPVAGAAVKPRPTRLDRWDYFELGSWGLCPRASAAITDADGRFTVGALPPDIYDLEVSADGLLSGRVRRLRAEASRTLDGIEIRLQRGAVLFGRVVDPHGAPIPWASVSTLSTETRAGEDGSFRLGNVPFGRSSFFVKIYSAGYEDLQQEIEVTTGASWVDFVLSERPRKPPFPVQERVAGPDGPPITPPVAREQEAPTTRGGIPVEILWKREPTTALSGHLRGLDPYERATIRAQAVRPERLPEMRDAEVELDHYSLDLQPGLWSIEAKSSACTIRRTIEIPPGATEIELDLDFTPPAATAEDAP